MADKIPKYEKETTDDGFILDSDAVLRVISFPSFMLNENTRAFGLRLPRMMPIKDKKGEIVGKEQKMMPAIITSERKIHYKTKLFGINQKIIFKTIPETMQINWKLEAIREFIDGADPPTLKEIFDKVRAQYMKFIYFQNDAWYDVHAVWDMATYFYDLFHAFPLIELCGLQATAKTKVMNVSRRMTLNATPVMVNPTAAVLFRETHTMRPTKYFDEVEKLFRFNYQTKTEESDERAEIINASYLQGATVPRIEKVGNKFVTRYYDCYSPCMLAGTKGLRGTTADRAITHIMTRSMDKDERGQLDPDDCANNPEWQGIRNDLYEAGLLLWREVKTAYDEFEMTDGKAKITRRDLQLWKPLFAIAKLVGEDVLHSIEDMSESVTTLRKDDFLSEGTQDFELLEIMGRLIGEKIYIADIKHSYCLAHEGEKIGRGISKIISGHLDRLGFKEYRARDKKGAFFNVPKDVFEQITATICPTLSSLPTPSSPLIVKDIKNDDDRVTIGDEGKKKKVTKVTIGDANDGIYDGDKKQMSGNAKPFWEKWPQNIKKTRAEAEKILGEKGFKKRAESGHIFEITPGIWRRP